MNNIYLELIDLTTMKSFKKYFKTEYDRQKFMNKIKYSKKLKVINSYNYMWGGKMTFNELFTEVKKCKTNKEVNELLDKYLESLEDMEISEEEDYFKRSNKSFK